MLLSRGHRVCLVVAIGSVIAAVPSRQASGSAHILREADAATPDTLRPYVRPAAVSRIEEEQAKAILDPVTAQVLAAVDALTGQTSVPARLVLNGYRRDHGSVTIDVTAENFPKVVFLNAGGTVRILPDGRRVVIAHHN